MDRSGLVSGSSLRSVALVSRSVALVSMFVVLCGVVCNKLI